MRAQPYRPRPTLYVDLAAYFANTGDTQVHAAQVVGTSQAYMSRIVNGHVVPRAHLAEKIATYASIPLDSFLRVYLAKHRENVA